MMLRQFRRCFGCRVCYLFCFWCNCLQHVCLVFGVIYLPADLGQVCCRESNYGEKYKLDLGVCLAGSRGCFFAWQAGNSGKFCYPKRSLDYFRRKLLGTAKVFPKWNIMRKLAWCWGIMSFSKIADLTLTFVTGFYKGRIEKWLQSVSCSKEKLRFEYWCK